MEQNSVKRVYEVSLSPFGALMKSNTPILMLFFIILCNAYPKPGLVWKKKMHSSNVVSLTGTDWGYGVSVAKDTVKIWKMRNGELVRSFFIKDVFTATIDSTLNYLVYCEYTESYNSNGYLKVLQLDSNVTIKSVSLREHETDTWFVKDFSYQSIICRRGYPLVVGSCIYVTKGQSNWINGRITCATFSASSKKPVEISDVETYSPIIIRFTDNGKSIYGRFNYYESYFHYPYGNSVKTQNLYETLVVPTLLKQESIDVRKQTDKFSDPLLQSKNGSLIYSKGSVYRLNDFRELKTGCIPDSILEVETIKDENHLLCLRKGKEVALSIWNVTEQRWEREFQGAEQTKLALTSDEKYAITSDKDGYISLWELPDSLKNDSIGIRFDIPKRKLYVGDTLSCLNKTFPYSANNSYLWDFGDGTNSAEEDVKKVYSTAGSYTITLTVVLENGTRKSKKQDVEVIYKPKGLIYTIVGAGKGKVESIDISSDNKSLMYCVEKDSVRVLNVSQDKMKALSSPPNPFYCAFSGIDDSLVVLCHKDTVMEPYSFVQRPLIRYCSGKVNSILLATNHSFVHNEEHYIDEFSEWKWYSPSLNYRYFRVGMSPQKDYIAVSSDLSYKYSTQVEVPNANSFRGSTNLVNNQHVLSKDNRYVSNKELCVSEIRSPIRSITVSPQNPEYAVAVGRFYDYLSQKCKESIPHIQIIDRNSQRIVKKLEDNSHCVRYSPDKYHLFSTSGVWDIDSSKLVHKISTPFTEQFEILPDGDNIVVPYKTEDGAIAGIYSVHENKWRTFLYGSPSRGLIDVTALTVSVDGRYIATGSSTGAVGLWQVPDSITPNAHAEFKVRKRVYITGETVEFINTSLPINGDFIYTWDFGDGTTSNEKNPKHNYLNDGLYTVSLLLSDKQGTEFFSVKNNYIEVTSISEVKSNNVLDEIEVFPNPVNDMVHLSNVTLGSEIKVVDCSGSIHLSMVSEYEQINIPTNTLTSGVYSIVVNKVGLAKSFFFMVLH